MLFIGFKASDEDIGKYARGELTFYFAGHLIAKEGGTTKPLEFCGFVVGNRPTTILGCPVG